MESEGKADILFLNNTTRHLQMRHITAEHMLDELSPFSQKSDQTQHIEYQEEKQFNKKKGQKMRYERRKIFINLYVLWKRLKNDLKIYWIVVLQKKHSK